MSPGADGPWPPDLPASAPMKWLKILYVQVIIGIVLAIFAPIVATLVQLAISRKREYLADASGALLTHYPDGLANALQKIGAYSQPMKTANGATAHLFIANPFGKVGKGLSNLFSTHPPIADRIRILRGLQTQHFAEQFQIEQHGLSLSGFDLEVEIATGLFASRIMRAALMTTSSVEGATTDRGGAGNSAPLGS